jgi:peptidyl-prolyl cis-trans isomerase C
MTRYAGTYMKFCFLLLATAFAWAQQPAFQAPPGSGAPAPAPAAPAVSPDTVVISVGETKITRAQFEDILSTIPEPQRAQFASPAGKKKLAEQFAELAAMANEARARKLDQTAAVKAEITLRVDQSLAQHLFQDFLANAKADDAALHAYYDAHKNDFESAKAKHILIRTGAAPGAPKPDQKPRTDAEALAMANDIRAKILAGGNWDELCKAFSDDTANAQSGGELGTFERGRMVPQFEKAAFEAEIGKVTPPVKTQFGYHLIIVEERKSKPFEEVKPQIEAKIKPEIAQKAVADLKAKSNISYDESYFGKATPPMPPAMPPAPPKQ